MDKEVRDRYYRVVGSLEALETAAKHASCMPQDVATFALLDAIRGLANKAVLSASSYAEERTSQGEEGSHG